MRTVQSERPDKASATEDVPFHCAVHTSLICLMKVRYTRPRASGAAITASYALIG